MKYLAQIIKNLFIMKDFNMDEYLLEKEFSVARRKPQQIERVQLPSPYTWTRI